MLVSTMILVLYFWAYFADVKTISSSLLVSDASAILAGVSIAVSVVMYLWAPRKYIFFAALAAYSLLVITSATLVLNTGGTTSPFIALWMVVSVFAGVFGYYGLLPIFGALAVYMIMLFTSGMLGREAVIAIVLAGELPLAISYMVWHTRPESEEADGDKAYRRLATELSQVAGKSEVVINAIADGVVALDHQGSIQLINPAAQQIIGWGRQDALTLNYKSVLKLVDKQDQELTTANDPISQVLATNKEITTKDLSLLTSSGKKLLVQVVVSPVGQIGAGVIVVFRDITKEKAEEREQAEFISTASHEMRTPVASIEGYLGLALNPATAQIDDKARDFLTKAHESAQHLGRLFQDLLDVSRADDSRLSNNPKVVDIVAFTHDIVQGLRPKAEQKGLRVIFKPQPDENEDRASERRLNPVFYVNVDNDHLREVISNLVENAIKYTLKGTVVVDVTGDNEHVTISIADSGIGIPAEDMAHLFQKFYRVDSSDTREIGGTGLGLYLCRRLTEAMNGRVWVESQYRQGSTFFVELPRTDHSDAMRLIETGSSPAAAAEETPALVVPPPPPMPPQPPPAPIPSQTPLMPATPPSVYAAPPVKSLSNTPLSSIEQNPEAYMVNRPGSVTIPPRNQN